MNSYANKQEIWLHSLYHMLKSQNSQLAFICSIFTDGIKVRLRLFVSMNYAIAKRCCKQQIDIDTLSM
jgi:hypothetical protein